MGMQYIKGIPVFGVVDEGAIDQIKNCAVNGASAAIMADGHLGYSQCVGGVVAYKDFISPSGVGYDIGCVDGETEFLSPKGWIKIKDYNGEKICQYDPENNEGEFVTPKSYIKKENNDGFYYLKSKNIDHVVSSDHDLLLFNPVSLKHFAMSAEIFINKHNQTLTGCYYKFKTSFNLKTKNELKYTDDILKIFVMVNADGHLENKNTKYYCVSLSKKRKIERARTLLKNAKIDYKESNPPSRNGKYHNFYFHFEDKSYDELWGASLEQLKVIVKEVFFWDGDSKGNVFFTRNKDFADFMQFAFISTNNRGVLREDVHKKDDKIDYRVFCHKSNYLSLKSNPKKGRKEDIVKKPSEDGFQYCFTVPSGYFVTRRNGKVIMTGNCGNKAVRLDVPVNHVKTHIQKIMREIFKNISFGVGRANNENVDHDLFDDDLWNEKLGKELKSKARQQLGTVGSGNHYVDVFVDEQDRIWIGVHFGSRGFGHGVATHFLKKAGAKDGIMEPPCLLHLDTDIGRDYYQWMKLAGRYAYAGRDWVCEKVASIIGGKIVEEVHNHHNYAWEEEHNGENLIVIRKGATPAFPGQKGFVGGSMGDISVILEGVESDISKVALYSTVHGAGRVMGRMEAKGKQKKMKDEHGNIVHDENGNPMMRVVKEGRVKREDMDAWLKKENVVLYGGDVDESPFVYKRLPEVLASHEETIRILHTLKPLGVCMAGNGTIDPYKD